MIAKSVASKILGAFAVNIIGQQWANLMHFLRIGQTASDSKQHSVTTKNCNKSENLFVYQLFGRQTTLPRENATPAATDFFFKENI